MTRWGWHGNPLFTPMKAYNEGKDAFRRGVSINANPYPPGNMNNSHWRTGWRMAESEPKAMSIEISQDECGDYSWRFIRNGELYQDHGFLSALAAERDAKSVYRCLERGVKLGDDYYPLHGINAEVACHIQADRPL